MFPNCRSTKGRRITNSDEAEFDRQRDDDRSKGDEAAKTGTFGEEAAAKATTVKRSKKNHESNF